MKKVWIGSTRTGNLIQEVEYTNKTNFNVTIQGDDRGEVIVPLSTIPSQYTGKLNTFFKKNERFFAEIDDQGRVGFAGPIENFTPNNNEAIVTNYCVGIALWLANVPCLPPANRERIDNQEATWTVTGTPAEIVRQVLAACLTESGNFAFPQSINPPVGGGGAVITHTFILSEVISLKDFFDDLAASYEGFEVVFVPRLATPTKIVWDCNVGEPHFRKNEAAIDIDIDQRGGGVTAFSYNENGKESTNWWFVRSAATKVDDPNWTDLRSVVKARPAGDEEYLTMFNKEFFSVAMTDAELASQESARLTASETDLKTYNISVFDENFDFVHRTGRRLQVTGSKRLVGLDEELRLTGTSWIINDPSSVQTTVQPATLRVFPRVPNRMSDLVKDQASEQAKQDAWRNGTMNPVIGGGPGGVDIPTSNWDGPKTIDKTYPAAEMVSPVTEHFFIGNPMLNSTLTENSWIKLSSPVWGQSFPEGGNIGPDSSTFITHEGLGRFYGLTWSLLVTKHQDEVSFDPWVLGVYKTRKFDGFPTWRDPQNGSYPDMTDENMFLSGTGGRVGELTSTQIKEQMMSSSAPSGQTFKEERLASGSFFKSNGTTEKFVVYIHQLQIFGGEGTNIRSKGIAFEIEVDQTNGDFIGSWDVIPYPFDVPNDNKTYYPQTSQVASHGPKLTSVSCLTPFGYWKDKHIPVEYPALISNAYWDDIGQGRRAVEDITITKNFKIDETWKTDGPKISVFQTEESEEDKWVESYQLTSFGGDLFATNTTFRSYYANVKDDDQREMCMRFGLRTSVDKDGKPNTWEILAAQYGYIANGGAYSATTYYMTTTPLSYLKDVVMIANIAGKPGINEAKMITSGKIPSDNTSSSFSVSDNRSGTSAKDNEFFPDFWNFSMSEDHTNVGQTRWWKGTEFVIPFWNGAEDTANYSATFHATSSGKTLNKNGFIVSPALTVSYLHGLTGGGSGSWYWYK